MLWLGLSRFSFSWDKTSEIFLADMHSETLSKCRHLETMLVLHLSVCVHACVCMSVPMIQWSTLVSSILSISQNYDLRPQMETRVCIAKTVSIIVSSLPWIWVVWLGNSLFKVGTFKNFVLSIWFLICLQNIRYVSTF